MLAIAQLLGRLIRWVSNTVLPTRSAGPAHQVHTAQSGKPSSVATTSHHNQPVPTQQSQSKEAAQSTTQARKSGKGSKTAQANMDKQLTVDGSKSKTHAHKTHQPANKAPKAKQKSAKQVIQAK